MKMKKTERIKKECDRKHRFVVGYIGDNNCLYDFKGRGVMHRTWVNPMTLFQAKRALKNLVDQDEPMAIYEIKPYETFNI